MSGVTIRRAAAPDAAALQALLEEHALHHGEVLERGAEALLRHGFGTTPLFRAILAERQGQACGFALFYPDYSSLRGRSGVMLQDLYVRPELRGDGVGRRLLACVMIDARDWQASFLTLMVNRANTKARAFYARHGFAERGDYETLILEGARLADLVPD